MDGFRCGCEVIPRVIRCLKGWFVRDDVFMKYGCMDTKNSFELISNRTLPFMLEVYPRKMDFLALGSSLVLWTCKIDV